MKTNSVHSISLSFLSPSLFNSPSTVSLQLPFYPPLSPTLPSLFQLFHFSFLTSILIVAIMQWTLQRQLQVSIQYNLPAITFIVLHSSQIFCAQALKLLVTLLLNYSNICLVSVLILRWVCLFVNF